MTAMKVLCQMQVGIVHDLMLRELRLFTDCGRCCRPLFIVDLDTQCLVITKAEIGLLQDRDTNGFGWSVSYIHHRCSNLIQTLQLLPCPTPCMLG